MLDEALDGVVESRRRQLDPRVFCRCRAAGRRLKNRGLTPIFQLSFSTEYQTRSATSVRPSLVRARRR